MKSNSIKEEILSNMATLSLHFLSLSNLSFETNLDRWNSSSRSAALAYKELADANRDGHCKRTSNVPQSVFSSGEFCAQATASLAADILGNISSQNAKNSSVFVLSISSRWLTFQSVSIGIFHE